MGWHAQRLCDGRGEHRVPHALRGLRACHPAASQLAGVAITQHPITPPPRLPLHHLPFSMDYDDWRGLLRDERLPCAVVDLDAFGRNVARFARIIASAGQNHTLRLATKSLRVPELIRRALDFGPPYQGLMSYAAAETEFLAAQGLDDFLVAYPSVQPADLATLRELHSQGKIVRLVVDSPEQLVQVSQAMDRLPERFPIVLDVDMSLRLLSGRVHLGVRRSPLRSTGDVLSMCDAAEGFPNVRVVGLMGYEAQVAALGDRNPFRSRLLRPVIRWIRSRSMRHIARLRQELATAMAQREYRLELFNGGGTGSANLSAKESHLTELTVGSGFLCPHLFDYYSNVQPEPACFFALQVTRSSDPGFVTCAGGGYTASGEAGADKVPIPCLPAGLRLIPTEGCGEVQTPLRVPPGVTLQPGDPVLFRHAKAGELAERFREYLLVAGGRIVARAPTYRGLGQCFL